MLKLEAIVGNSYNVLDPLDGLNCNLSKISDLYQSRSIETRKKLSISNKGKLAGNKNYFYGKKGELSPMYGKFGEKHHNYGKKQSKEWIKNNAESRKVSVLQYDMNNCFIKEWFGMKETCEQLSIDLSTMIRCCQGKSNHAGGYKWKYKILPIL